MKYKLIKELSGSFGMEDGGIKIGEIFEPTYEGSDTYWNQSKSIGVQFNIRFMQDNPEYWEKITEEKT